MTSSFFTSGFEVTDVTEASLAANEPSLWVEIDDFSNLCLYQSFSQVTDNDLPIIGNFRLIHLIYINIGVLIFTIVGGTIGNLLVFLSMRFEDKLMTCVNGLHGNLALTDAFNCMLGATLHLVRFFLDPHTAAFHQITEAEHFVLHYNITASCLSVMALSFLKYWKLTHPLNKQPCKVIYLTMAVIQIVSVMFGITGLFDSRGMLVACRPSIFPSVNVPMWTILFILIPLFLFTLLFTAVLKMGAYLTLKKEQASFNKIMARVQAQKSASRYDFTGARGAFLMMIVVQIVCYLPFVVYYVWCFLSNKRSVVIDNVIVTCLLCSCAINPFLYTLRCHTYRRTLKRILGVKKVEVAKDDLGTSRAGTAKLKLTIDVSAPEVDVVEDGNVKEGAINEMLANSPDLKTATVPDNLVEHQSPSRGGPMKSPGYRAKPMNLFMKNCPCNIADIGLTLDEKCMKKIPPLK